MLIIQETASNEVINADKYDQFLKLKLQHPYINSEF